MSAGSGENKYDTFENGLERVLKDGSGTVTSDEKFVYDGCDTAKPGAVGNENFDAVMDLDASNNVTVRQMYGAGFDDLLARQTAAGH